MTTSACYYYLSSTIVQRQSDGTRRECLTDLTPCTHKVPLPNISDATEPETLF